MAAHPEIPAFNGGGSAEFGVPPEQLPPTVARFVNRLTGLRLPRMVEVMPDLAPHVDHSGGEVAQRAVENLDHAYFAPEIMGEPGSEPPVGYDFTLKKGWELGRNESQHQAFFGTINVSLGGRQRKDVAVAVKEYPYPVGHLAVKEQGLLQDLGRRGLPVVKPLGIVLNRWNMDPGVFVVTKMELDLESLNAQDWTRVQPEEVLERVKPVTDTLSMLHGEGVFPHELAFGNVGVGESEDSRFIFDLESAKSFRDILDNIGPNDPIPDDLFIAFRRDFVPPRVSLRNFAYGNLPPANRPANPSELYTFEYELLYRPYLEAIQESNSPYRSVLERMYRQMMEHVRTEVEAGIYAVGMYPPPGA